MSSVVATLNRVASPSALSRRDMLAAMAGIPVGSAAAESAEDDETKRKSSVPLVAYFSRSGNTRVVAGLIQRGLGADLFEIRPAIPYPEDYLETVEKARDERDRGFEPKLAAGVSSIATYDTLYLGFPIWGETAPPVIRSFLKSHDVTGKTLIPFITHGGYGLGSSRAVLASHAPGALLMPGFSMQDKQERQTMAAVNSWLRASKATSKRSAAAKASTPR